MEIIEDELSQELEHLLQEDILSVQNRERCSFDPQEERIKKNGIILFGCGLFGRKILKGLREIGIEPIGFSDNNSKLWGNVIDGLTILSPEDAATKYSKAAFMLAMWSDVNGHPFNDVEKKLHSFNNVEVISFFYLFWKYPEIYLPYFSIDMPEKTIKEAGLIKECFSLFEDDLSRKEFVAQIKWRLWGDYIGLSEPVSFTHYFPDDLFELRADEVFIDCGAFDGDTLKNFLKMYRDSFGKYYGFEPDPITFNKFSTFVSTLPENIQNKVVVEQYAVSDTEKVISFNSDGSLQSSISDTGNIKVNCISIDDKFRDRDITYIKMDVEGAEPDVIIGAAGTIKKISPILAVSVYHQFNHLWLLPLAIKKLSDNYKFFLRPHCKASWDLVCYAVPKSRLKNHNP